MISIINIVMDNIFGRQSTSTVKLSGLDTGLDLDADKVTNTTLALSAQQRLEAERLKKWLLNRQFDPNFMEFNIDSPSDTGPITFDPSDIKFNNL